MAKVNTVKDAKTQNFAQFNVNEMNPGDIYSLLIGIDKDHIRLFYAVLKDLNAALENTLKHSLTAGEKVWFISKRGYKVEGVVTQIGRGKVVRIKTNDGVMWRVSPSLLQKGE